MMISREEKNKELDNEIKREKIGKIYKKILLAFFVILILFILLFLYTYFISIKFLKTNEYVIKDNNIPNSFNGVKILHFSDLLYDNNCNLKKLEEEIILVNPDIVFFTGNLINNDYEIKEEEIKLINSFLKRIPYKIGKYAVYGKNDHQTFNLIMENTDFIILNNEIIQTYYNNDYINIIGLNPKEKKEIKKDNGNYTISLIHNYDDYHMFNINSNLVLAGSNLGGEIKLFNLPLIKNNQYMDNYYKENNSIIYISNGIGSPHHMRLMNSSSINVYRFIK